MVNILKKIIGELTVEIIKNYKIDKEHAREIILTEFQKNKKLIGLFNCEYDIDAVKRMSIYRNSVKKIKKNVYYKLRNFKLNTDEIHDLIVQLKNISNENKHSSLPIINRLVKLYSSTKERLDSIDNFNRLIIKYIKENDSIVDIGCGVYPLLFPFSDWNQKIKKYIAIDNDDSVIEIIKSYSYLFGYNNIGVIKWDIREGTESLLLKTNNLKFDIAFLFKIVPMFFRQNSKYIDILRGIPARLFIISGSVYSMTKYKNIVTREKKVILNFIKNSELEIVEEKIIGEEIIFITRKMNN